jgi:hypothetical protein
MGRPNWTRDCAYDRASSSAACATPTPRAAVWMRALSNVAMSCLNPCPSTAPSRAPSGTANPSNDSSYSFMPRYPSTLISVPVSPASTNSGSPGVPVRVFGARNIDSPP